MAGDPVLPGSGDPRYERLTGGADKRTEIYLARRYFGMSREEWGSLPWWETATLLQELMEDLKAQAGGSQDQQKSPQPTPQPSQRDTDLATLGLGSVGGFSTRVVG